MADLNIPANDAHMEQAPAVAPPTRTNDQILPLSKWVPIGKSNNVLDVHKPHRNLIFPMAVALLNNANFFRAFTLSSTIPAIYIHQFWDTMCFNSSTGLYSCQLDEQSFNLHKDILIDALNITLTNDNNPFVAPPSSDTEESSYCLRWERKKDHPIYYIPNVRFTKLITHHLRTKHNIHPRTGSPLHYSHDENVLNTLRFVGKDGREIFGMPIPDALLTDEIKGAPYYGDYQEHVAKYQQFLDAEHGKVEEGGATKSSKATKVTKAKAAKVTKTAGDKAPKPTATQPLKPKPAPTQPSKAVLEKKRKLVKETPNEPSPSKRSKGGLVTKKRKPKSPLKLVDEPSDEGVPGPAYPVVIREPDSGRIQPLPEASKINARNQEGQARPNPGEQDEGRAGPNPGIAVESQLQTSHVENLKLPTEDQVILEEPASSTGTLSSLQNLEKDISFTNQFFVEKPQEEEPGKTNVKAKVQSMVSVSIHQDTSSVPLMTTPVIDLTTMQSDSPLPTSIATTSIITTTSLPPPPQPQQSTTDMILVSQAVDEIVTDVVDWAIQAPL
ncbi:hypothetical protein Tco_1428756 [Tanacetum coccineum]